MKFLSLSLFAATVLGQASVISDALSTIADRTTALDTAINGFSGAGDVPGLQSAASAVISAINAGNSAVSAIEPLDALGASSLIPNIQALASQVDTTVTDLINKKSLLSPYGQVIEQNLNEIKTATNTFASTTYTKIPEGLRSTAQGLVQPIIDSLNRGIAAYQGTGGNTSSSSSSSVSTSTSSGVSSSSTSTVTSSGAPSYTTSSGAVISSSSTLVTSVGTVTSSVPTSTGAIVPPITSEPASTSTPPAYNPNGASQLSGGFAAVVVAAAVAVAAF